jgi:hypothetical protein
MFNSQQLGKMSNSFTRTHPGRIFADWKAMHVGLPDTELSARPSDVVRGAESNCRQHFVS